MRINNRLTQSAYQRHTTGLLNRMMPTERSQHAQSSPQRHFRQHASMRVRGSDVPVSPLPPPDTRQRRSRLPDGAETPCRRVNRRKVSRAKQSQLWRAWHISSIGGVVHTVCHQTALSRLRMASWCLLLARGSNKFRNITSQKGRETSTPDQTKSKPECKPFVVLFVASRHRKEDAGNIENNGSSRYRLRY